MFSPYYHITNTILKNIGSIDAAREIIENTAVISVWETKLKKDSFERLVFHLARLEGNRLSDDEVMEILDGREILAREREIADIKNLKKTVEFCLAIVEKIHPGRPYVLTEETILELHRLATWGMVPQEVSGVLRERQVVIKHSQSGEVVYSPPPAVEVPFLIEDIANWINSEEGKEIHPVIKAAIIQFEILRIQPFVVGNAKVAILLSDLVLFLDGYFFKGFFTLEEYFDSNVISFYTIWQKVANQQVLDTNEINITEWIEYYVKGFVGEVVRLKEQVQRVSSESHVKNRLGFTLELSERQMLIVEYLKRHGSMMNKDFRKIFPDFSDDTVLREMKFLKQKGLVKKVGGTKKAKYTLV